MISGVVLIVAFLGWFACLARGEMPHGLRNVAAYGLRYTAETFAYLLLVTPTYPTSDPTLPASAGPDTGAPDRTRRRRRPPPLAADDLLPPLPHRAAHGLAAALGNRRGLRGRRPVVLRPRDGPPRSAAAPFPRGVHPVPDPRRRVPLHGREPVPGLHRQARVTRSTCTSRRRIGRAAGSPCSGSSSRCPRSSLNGALNAFCCSRSGSAAGSPRSRSGGCPRACGTQARTRFATTRRSVAYGMLVTGRYPFSGPPTLEPVETSWAEPLPAPVDAPA